MPRCGCSRGLDAIECTCEVTSGDPRISVEGNGTPGISPYVISLTTSGPGVDVEDTDTVDMTISGEDPAVISSEVRLSTDTGNALRKGSDGGLYVADGTAMIPPTIGMVYQTVPQTIPDQTPTPLLWDAADTGAPPDSSVLTVAETGPYILTAACDYDGQFSVNRLSLWIAVAGDPYNRLTATWRAQFDPAAFRPGVSGSEPVWLEQGQLIEVCAFQASGQPRTTWTGDRATRLRIAFLGAPSS
jgi:hypothetical protein